MQATKSIISGTNTQALTAKADLLKEEMDEAMNKVELCKVTCSYIVTASWEQYSVARGDVCASDTLASFSFF